MNRPCRFGLLLLRLVPTTDAVLTWTDQLDDADELPRFALSDPGSTMTHASESEHGGYTASSTQTAGHSM